MYRANVRVSVSENPSKASADQRKRPPQSSGSNVGLSVMPWRSTVRMSFLSCDRLYPEGWPVGSKLDSNNLSGCSTRARVPICKLARLASLLALMLRRTGPPSRRTS